MSFIILVVTNNNNVTLYRWGIHSEIHRRRVHRSFLFRCVAAVRSRARPSARFFVRLFIIFFFHTLNRIHVSATRFWMTDTIFVAESFLICPYGYLWRGICIRMLPNSFAGFYLCGINSKNTWPANMKTHGKHGREPDNDDLLDLAPSEISRILVAIFSVYILCNIIFYNNNYKPL